MNEIWKTIPGSDNCRISNFGNVVKGVNQFIDIQSDAEGYLRCSFGGTVGRDRIHRLVAKMFVKNDDPENKKFVDHIDGNKQNNRADNLRWVTSKQNTQYAADMGKFSNPQKNIPVSAINTKTGKVVISNSQMSLCKKENLDDGSVNKVLKNKRITTHDWLIRYLTEENLKSLVDDLKECGVI